MDIAGLRLHGDLQEAQGSKAVSRWPPSPLLGPQRGDLSEKYGTTSWVGPLAQQDRAAVS